MLQPETLEIVIPPIPIALSFSFTIGRCSVLIIASIFFMGPEDAPSSVRFLAGSVTSISGQGLVMPYGGTTDGIKYLYGGQEIRTTGVGGNDLNGAPPRMIQINMKSIVADAGSLLDLSGGGELTGPSPVDRGRKGTKHTLLVDRHGVPLAIRTAGANASDPTQIIPLVLDFPRVTGKPGRPKERPDELYADRGDDSDDTRWRLRWLGIEPHIAKRRTEHGSGLGKVRWVVERTISWLKGLRRLRVRYDRLGVMIDAWTTLAAADCELSCCVASGGNVYVGTDDARVFRLGSSELTRLEAFERVEGRAAGTLFAGQDKIKLDNLTARAQKTFIDGFRLTRIFFGNPISQLIHVLADDTFRVIGGATVNDDVFQARVVLLKHRLDRLLEIFALIVGRGHNRNEGLFG